MSSDFNDNSDKSIEVIKTSKNKNKNKNKKKKDDTIFEKLANTELTKSERMNILKKELRKIDKKISKLKKFQKEIKDKM